MRLASWTLGRSVVCRSNTCHFAGDLGNCDSRTYSQVRYYAGIVGKSRKWFTPGNCQAGSAAINAPMAYKGSRFGNKKW